MKRMMRPVHPGEVLREDVIPALGKSKTEIARLLGISRQTLHDVLCGKQPVTTGLERDAKKWEPVFRNKSRENKDSRAECDSI